MVLQQKVALGYFVVLLLVASLNYLPIPGLIDAEGRTFGIFALDIYDDALHLASAVWAGWAAWTSRTAAGSGFSATAARSFSDSMSVGGRLSTVR